MPGSVDLLLAHRRRFIQAVPIQFGEVYSLENTGTQRLELTLVGAARDMRREMEYTDEPGRGAQGLRPIYSNRGALITIDRHWIARGGSD